MVGYTRDRDTQLNPSDYALAGAVSSSVSRVVGQPFDVLKIRFQLQLEPISKRSTSSKYQSIYQAVRCIVREEGYVALWKGHIPAQTLSVGFGVIQFTVMEHLTKMMSDTVQPGYEVMLRPAIHTICGGLAACVATIALQPLDILRTRFVAQGEPKIYRSFLHAGMCIVEREGVMGFYKGLLPAMAGVAPQMGIQFGLYASLQNTWNTAFKLPHNHHPGTIESLVCGSGAGILAKLAVYPMDIVKKRLQIQGFEEARKPFGATRHYTGMVHCVKCVVREEGIHGLFKGLSPSLLKAGVVSGTIFCVYDHICALMVLRNR